MNRWTFTDEEFRRTRARVRTWGVRGSEALVVGVIAVLPLALALWVLWLVLQVAAFVGGLMTAPLVVSLVALAPGLEGFLRNEVFATILNVVVAVAALIVVGFLARGVIGQVVGRMVEDFITRIPIGNTVYGSARQLINSFQTTTDKAEKVVLIEFPSRDMKAVGLVTRRFFAADTGEELAAVYVPTTPNPTSGYVEIVPVNNLVWLDWSLNEALQFIVSGGVIAPDAIVFRAKGVEAETAPPTEPV